MTKKLSIGFIGTRGIPNEYGGYESAIQELAPRLVRKGHKVVVYSSSLQTYKENTWHGVDLDYNYDPEDKLGSFGQFVYDFKCNISAKQHKHDVIFHMGYTSDSIWHWLWDRNAMHITNMDGMEWMRSKYSLKVQKFLKKAEKWAANKSKLLIADSTGIMNYLTDNYSTPAVHIAYGVEIPGSFDKKYLSDYNLEPGGYDLLIARMVPENNIEMAIKAKIISLDDFPLVIFGNSNDYCSMLRKQYHSEKRIRFMDANYNKIALDSVRHFSRYYIHGHSVGGTNPSLLEAMAAGCRVIAHNNEFNSGVLGSGGEYFSTIENLIEIFNQDSFTAIKQSQIEMNISLLKKVYNWERISNEYVEAAYSIL